MRSHRRNAGGLALLAALAGLLASASAGAVTITCGTGSALAGQSLDINLSSSDLTGLAVKSYQFALTYDPNQVTATNVVTAGTLTGTAGWSNVTFNVTSGRIAVSGAGTSSLAGAGVLVKISFLVNASLINGGGSGLNFQSFLMNEGTPKDTTSNGSISINPTPQIYVSPNTGEIVIGQTLQFSANGSVTNPVSWGTTNPAVATISSSGLLTGVSHGSVRVYAVDAASRRDTTDGDILIRATQVSVGTATVFLGQSASIPVTVSNIGTTLNVAGQGHAVPATVTSTSGVRSGQFVVSFNSSLITLTSVTTPPGTLLNGYGSMNYSVNGGRVSVDFAGTTDLTGGGVLFYLNFTASAVNSGGTGLSLDAALFNEDLPAVRVSGSFYVNAPPGIYISPASVTLFAGQQQQFSVGGSPTPPITWSTLNPTVASINSSGLLTALAGGVTQVHAVDNVGASATSGNVTVYDFQLTLGTITVGPGFTAVVPLTLDRAIGGLGVYAVQYSVTYDPTWITAASAGASELFSTWGAPTVRAISGRINVATAGNHPLPSGQTALNDVNLTVSAATPYGTDIPLTLTGVVFNEGHPVPVLVNGRLQVRGPAETGNGGPLSFSLSPPLPNPTRGPMRFRFAIPQARAGGERVRLAIYAPDGRRVRMLIDELREAGDYEARWDGLDAAARTAKPGIYFGRLEWRGQTLERKIALMR